MLTTIPFSGFYGSIHEQQIDDCLEQMVSDSSGCHPASDHVSEELWSHTGNPRPAYAKAYCENFTALLNDWTGLNIRIKFESLSSPREYNFTTDRIFAELSYTSARTLLCKCDKKILSEVAAERFTSCSGFISSYSPDWKSWGELRTWDHNQLGTIFEALVEQFFGEDWEWNVIEDFNCNGDLDNWIYEAMDAEGKRLVKIADYLRSREERKFRA
jgi:hypothetical protein